MAKRAAFTPPLGFVNTLRFPARIFDLALTKKALMDYLSSQPETFKIALYVPVALGDVGIEKCLFVIGLYHNSWLPFPCRTK